MIEILKAQVDDEVDALEMASDDLLSGDPRPKAKVMLHSGQDPAGGMSGIFVASPGAVRSPVAAHETLHVVEGRARFERHSGEAVDVQPGDIVVLPAGDWTFKFESSFRAVFVTAPSAPDPSTD